MADEKRTLLIDVEVEDKDFDQAIGEVNVELQKNQDLIRELKKDYEANATTIAKLEGENRELSASKRDLIKQSKLEEGSLEALRAKLAAQTKERNSLNTSTEEGAERFEELQGSIKGLSEEISGFEEAGGDFRRNVGNYPTLADNAKGAFSKLWATLAANPLLLLAGAFAALVKVVGETQTGQELFRKGSAALNTTLGFLKDIVEGLTQDLIDIFSNPQQAVIDFGQLIQDWLITRFEGMLELIPNLAESVRLLFEGEFAAAGELAVNSIAKVTLGVENLTGKLTSAGQAVSEFFEDVAAGTELAFALEERLIANEKALADFEVTASASLRRQKELNLLIEDTSRTYEERLEAAEELDKVEAALINEQIRLHKERIDLYRRQNDITNSTEEDVQRLRDAIIQLNVLETASLERRTTAQNKFNTIRMQQESQAEKEQNDRWAREEVALQEHLDKQTEMDRQAKEAQKQIDDQAAQAALENQNTVQASFFSLVGSSSKAAKALAIAQTIQNTAQGVMKAWAQVGIFGGPIAAATVAAAGAVQIAKIKRTKIPGEFGSGGDFGGGGSSGASTGPGQVSIDHVRAQTPNRSLAAVNALASEEARAGAVAANENARAVQDAIDGMPAPQVAVTDINTAQDDRSTKVGESTLA